MQMTSLIAILNAIYSASVVDNAIVVCSFDAHTIGHLANLITYPVRDKRLEDLTHLFYHIHLRNQHQQNIQFLLLSQP